MFTDKNVIILMMVFGLVVGVFNALGTVVEEFSFRYDFTIVITNK